MIEPQNKLPPQPPKFLTMGFYIPEYKGPPLEFDPGDVIEGEEACRAYDEEQKMIECEKEGKSSLTDNTSPGETS